MCHHQLRFIPGIQGQFNICKSSEYVSKIKDKSHAVISLDVEKAFKNNLMPFHDKNNQQIQKKKGTSST